MLGFINNNKQAIIGVFVAVSISLVFKLPPIQSFFMGAAMCLIGIILDHLDGKV